MMYPWNNSPLVNTMPYIATTCKKEVQKIIYNALIVINCARISITLYESEGRAFESLRVRHPQPVSEVFKIRFVPLILFCTSLCKYLTPCAYANSTYRILTYPKMRLLSLWLKCGMMLEGNLPKKKPDGLKQGRFAGRVECNYEYL